MIGQGGALSRAKCAQEKVEQSFALLNSMLPSPQLNFLCPSTGSLPLENPVSILRALAFEALLAPFVPCVWSWSVHQNSKYCTTPTVFASRSHLSATLIPTCTSVNLSYESLCSNPCFSTRLHRLNLSGTKFKLSYIKAGKKSSWSYPNFFWLGAFKLAPGCMRVTGVVAGVGRRGEWGPVLACWPL